MDERLASVLKRAGAYLEDDDLCALEQILEEASTVIELKPESRSQQRRFTIQTKPKKGK